jgi:prepilin peptidase CpaA
MLINILLVVVLPALLVGAAIWDLMSYTIPNLLICALLAVFCAVLAVLMLSGAGFSWDDAGLHLLAGFVALLAGMALFAAGYIGGGDAKLFATASLWLGWNTLFEYTILATLLGGVLTLGFLAFRRIPLPSFLARQAWVARVADPREGIPYGVALSAAALLMLPETQIYRLFAGD